MSNLFFDYDYVWLHDNPYAVDANLRHVNHFTQLRPIHIWLDWVNGRIRNMFDGDFNYQAAVVAYPSLAPHYADLKYLHEQNYIAFGFVYGLLDKERHSISDVVVMVSELESKLRASVLSVARKAEDFRDCFGDYIDSLDDYDFDELINEFYMTRYVSDQSLCMNMEKPQYIKVALANYCTTYPEAMGDFHGFYYMVQNKKIEAALALLMQMQPLSNSFMYASEAKALQV